jgi:hypothetical protein
MIPKIIDITSTYHVFMIKTQTNIRSEIMFQTKPNVPSKIVIGVVPIVPYFRFGPHPAYSGLYIRDKGTNGIHAFGIYHEGLEIANATCLRSAILEIKVCMPVIVRLKSEVSHELVTPVKTEPPSIVDIQAISVSEILPRIRRPGAELEPLGRCLGIYHRDAESNRKQDYGHTNQFFHNSFLIVTGY